MELEVFEKGGSLFINCPLDKAPCLISGCIDCKWFEGSVETINESKGVFFRQLEAQHQFLIANPKYILCNFPQKKKVKVTKFLNIFNNGLTSGHLYDSEDLARERGSADNNYLDTIKIEYEVEE